MRTLARPFPIHPVQKAVNEPARCHAEFFAFAIFKKDDFNKVAWNDDCPDRIKAMVVAYDESAEMPEV